MSQTGEWRFRRMQPGEMNIDPIEAEFFSTEALGSLADALVREAVQNSLDARRPGEQLRVRIAFPGPEAFLGAERAAAYTRGLARHVGASRSGLTALPAAGEPMSFVVIEDFGTRGLQGDPRQSEDAEIDACGASRNDFFYFWRNVGRSRKHAAELGRWGLGKTVFQAASRLNAFYALSVRADDDRRLLMGQAVLKIHKLDGQRYYPYGYFGRFEDDFALPVEDAASLDEFCASFGLARDTQAGLSVVVPYPDEEITPQAVTESVVRHYFMPIIAGDLVVDMAHGKRTRRLDETSLAGFVDAARGAAEFNLQQVFELARWAMSLPRDRHTRLAPPPGASAPRWADERVDESALAGLRREFDSGRPVAVTVPVWVKPAAGEPTLSEFDLYLERDSRQERAEQHFVRDGITVAGVRTSLPKGIRAIVSVRDRALSELLGDSENPAHTEWQERSPKFKNRYRHGPYTLRYVRNAPREIVRLLTRPAQGRDYALLQELFSLAIPNEALVHENHPADPAQRGLGDGLADGVVETGGRGNDFRLQKLHGGFRLAGTGSAAQTPRRIAVWAAYDVRRGNPFARYQKPDFEMGQGALRIDTAGAAVERCSDNVLVLEVQRPDFELTVRGFDPHRDVRVKILPLADG